MLERHKADYILQAFNNCGSTITDLLTTVSCDATVSDHPLVHDITNNALDIISALHHHPLAHHPITKWAHDLVNRSFVKSIRDLSSVDNGWHFSAVNASVRQINNFRIEDIAQRIHSTAPALWNTVYSLLVSSSTAASHHESQLDADGTAEDAEDSEAQLWNDFVNPAESSQDPIDLTDPTHPWYQWKRSERRDAIRRVVSQLD